jgi:hypothetical protein
MDRENSNDTEEAAAEQQRFLEAEIERPPLQSVPSDDELQEAIVDEGRYTVKDVLGKSHIEESSSS